MKNRSKRKKNEQRLRKKLWDTSKYINISEIEVLEGEKRKKKAENISKGNMVQTSPNK